MVYSSCWNEYWNLHRNIFSYEMFNSLIKRTLDPKEENFLCSIFLTAPKIRLKLDANISCKKICLFIFHHSSQYHRYSIHNYFISKKILMFSKFYEGPATPCINFRLFQYRPSYVENNFFLILEANFASTKLGLGK